MKKRMWSGMLAGILLCAPSAWATTYTLDPDHTTVSFKVLHLLTKVQGWFNECEGSVVYVPGQPEQWQADATIQAASIDTHVQKRDDHLRSPDFFDVERYPAITFKSTGVTNATDTTATLQGVLTMHGVAKPVMLDLEIHGVVKDPRGNLRAAFTATTTVNRKDFGLTWNKVLETGQLLVGEDVQIVLEVEGVAQE